MELSFNSSHSYPGLMSGANLFQSLRDFSIVQTSYSLTVLKSYSPTANRQRPTVQLLVSQRLDRIEVCCFVGGDDAGDQGNAETKQHPRNIQSQGMINCFEDHGEDVPDEDAEDDPEVTRQFGQ